MQDVPVFDEVFDEIEELKAKVKLLEEQLAALQSPHAMGVPVPPPPAAAGIDVQELRESVQKVQQALATAARLELPEWALGSPARLLRACHLAAQSTLSRFVAAFPGSFSPLHSQERNFGHDSIPVWFFANQVARVVEVPVIAAVAGGGENPPNPQLVAHLFDCDTMAMRFAKALRHAQEDIQSAFGFPVFAETGLGFPDAPLGSSAPPPRETGVSRSQRLARVRVTALLRSNVLGFERVTIPVNGPVPGPNDVQGWIQLARASNADLANPTTTCVIPTMALDETQTHTVAFVVRAGAHVTCAFLTVRAPAALSFAEAEANADDGIRMVRELKALPHRFETMRGEDLRVGQSMNAGDYLEARPFRLLLSHRGQLTLLRMAMMPGNEGSVAAEVWADPQEPSGIPPFHLHIHEQEMVVYHRHGVLRKVVFGALPAAVHARVALRLFADGSVAIVNEHRRPAGWSRRGPM